MKQFKFCPFEVDVVPNFRLNLQFCFLDQIAPKMLFPAENRKREHHHSNLHIRICLGTKMTNLTDNFDFLGQIRPKKVFPAKNETTEPKKVVSSRK